MIVDFGRDVIKTKVVRKMAKLGSEEAVLSQGVALLRKRI